MRKQQQSMHAIQTIITKIVNGILIPWNLSSNWFLTADKCELNQRILYAREIYF